MALAIDLTGKTVLVCGCHEGGIGGATARAGGALVLLDKDEETVAATAQEVRAQGAIVNIGSISTKFSGGARRSRKEMRELQQQQSGSA